MLRSKLHVDSSARGSEIRSSSHLAENYLPLRRPGISATISAPGKVWDSGHLEGAVRSRQVALAGAIYVWPFAASKFYKRLVIGGVRQGRIVALLKKIISLIVSLIVLLGSIIFVRGFSSKSLVAVDFCLFLATAVASGWLAWRYFYNPRVSL
jgi:hypothetical protein